MRQIKAAVETMIQFTALYQMRPFQPPLWLPVRRNRRYQQTRQRVDDFIGQRIAARRALPEDRWPPDLLSKLMQAQDETTGEHMSDKLLRGESVTLFFAGHETTARTLTFAWYALSQNPEAQARLQAEVDQVLGDRVPTADDLKQMPYALQAIKETLRLCPPATLYARDAAHDDVIDGFPVPAGGLVMLLPVCTHRHPDFWPDPEVFDPDRWTPK